MVLALLLDALLRAGSRVIADEFLIHAGEQLRIELFSQLPRQRVGDGHGSRVPIAYI